MATARILAQWYGTSLKPAVGGGCCIPMQCSTRARCFDLLVGAVRVLLGEFGGLKGQPTTVAIDSHTLQPTLQFGARAGDDGTKVPRLGGEHRVDTLSNMMAPQLTPADAGDRARLEALAGKLQ